MIYYDCTMLLRELHGGRRRRCEARSEANPGMERPEAEGRGARPKRKQLVDHDVFFREFVGAHIGFLEDTDEQV